MGKRFRTDHLDQALLLPPSLHDWLPEGHLARFIAGVIEELDLGLIYRSYEGDGRGLAAYQPAMMVRLLLYGYCLGVVSSRKMERATHEDVAFRYLSADTHPDHDTIAAFRKRHLEALAGLFVQALRLCQKAGLAKLGHVAIDGTKIKANASKHKAMSYERMNETEQRLEPEVEELLRRAAAVDEAEAKIAERREQEARTGKKAGGHDPKVPDPEQAKPEAKAQRNFTDPDSRIMVDGANKGSFIQAYNAQAAVDSQAQVVVAAEITREANDSQQLVPMIEQAQANAGRKPEAVSADAGYWSEDNVRDERVAGVDLYIATGRQKHGEKVESAHGPPPEDASVQQAMQHKLRTEAGHSIYKMRKAIVEPVFGQTKERRGFRRFSFRGVGSVRLEWKLICLTGNILKLFRSGWSPQTARKSPRGASRNHLATLSRQC